jgi:hypothetical protein
MNNDEKGLMDKAGGRKALAFYAALACCFVLAMMDKAHAEVLGLIDTLYAVFALGNVMSKRMTPIQQISQMQQSQQPQQPNDSMEKP